MSRYVGRVTQTESGLTASVYRGFSWPCLFFGAFWYLVKGMYGLGLLAFVLALPTFGLSWLIMPFLANRQYREHLATRGYRRPEARRVPENGPAATARAAS
jgi:hypothetical protein